MLFKSARKRYINWEDYKGLIRAREIILFINNTAKMSCSNLLKKEVAK